MSEPAHPYHLVEPSPWPFAGSLAALLTATGAVTYFHDRAQPWLLVAGVALVVTVAGLWWRDVVREARDQHRHTVVVQHGLRVGMVLFIASEVMFFVAFFWAFFNASLTVNPSVETWPPPGIEPLDTWHIPFVNTLILLSSGVAVNWAHHALRRGADRVVVAGLALAVVLGIVFLSLQAYEYGEATFGFKEGVYPTVFYMATGFHGFHVFVGVCFLSVCLLRAWRREFLPGQHVGFEAAAWYWHFVDVVWLFLFVWVYWWGNG
ncbi:MAG: cytochrome c oxidase subunit 3 [Magnetospirillum sp.]|nr:cytochrome c oxidase subunit 3 [Magnetospirillum sp.]